MTTTPGSAALLALADELKQELSWMISSPERMAMFEHAERVIRQFAAKADEDGRGSDAAEADRYFDLASEFGNRIQRAVTLIEDYDRHGSVDHSAAFEMKKILDPKNAFSTTGHPNDL